jgi:hypothetical protein
MAKSPAFTPGRTRQLVMLSDIRGTAGCDSDSVSLRDTALSRRDFDYSMLYDNVTTVFSHQPVGTMDIQHGAR